MTEKKKYKYAQGRMGRGIYGGMYCVIVTTTPTSNTHTGIYTAYDQ